MTPGQDAAKRSEVTKGQEIAEWVFNELEEARSLNEAEIATRIDAAVAEARREERAKMASMWLRLRAIVGDMDEHLNGPPASAPEGER